MKRYRTIVTRVILLALTGATLAGCWTRGGPADPRVMPMDTLIWPSTGDEPMVLDVSGPVELDVETFNGNVVITADDRYQGATVQVVRHAVHGPERAEESEASLDEITYTADVEAGDLGQKIVVRARTAHAEPHFQRAHIYIHLPEADGLRVRTRFGNVYARGISGRVDVATHEGEVQILTNQPMTEPVTILNNGGDIAYRVRGESSARFDAQAVGGRVVHHIRYGAVTIEPGTGQSRLLGRLNHGENPVVLRTVDGEIRIAVVSNPEQIGQYIMD